MSGRKRGRTEDEGGARRKREKPNVARAAVARAEDPENLDYEDDHEDEIHPDDQKILRLAGQMGKMTTDDGEYAGPEGIDEEDEEAVAAELAAGLGDDEEEEEEEEGGAGPAGMDDDEEEDGDDAGDKHADFALKADDEDEEVLPAATNERPAAAAGAGAGEAAMTPEELAAAKKRQKNKEKKKKKKEKEKKAKAEEKKKKEQAQPEAFLPHKHKLEDGETLEYDSTAYTTFHQLSVNWPCLSFDIIRDNLGAQRLKFPLTMYLATGTQAGDAKSNTVQLWKIRDIHKTVHDDESDPDDDDEDLDDDPTIEEKLFRHDGVVNRIRCSPHRPGLLATQSSNGSVFVWNAVPLLQALDAPPSARLPKMQPIARKNQGREGYALEWASMKEGRLFSGSCKGEIFLFDPKEADFKITRLAAKHNDSVEDIQASSQTEFEFASCSVDGTVRLWDLRTPDACVNGIKASKTDVNVISWNRLVPNHIASGDDDGAFKVWDIRSTAKEPLAHFHYHKKAITSIEWRPHDKDELAVTSEDNMATIWDLGVEPDSAASADNKEPDVPPQLLFQHLGQTNPKELHWHPQIPGLLITTAESGFNLWRPADLQVPQPKKKA